GCGLLPMRSSSSSSFLSVLRLLAPIRNHTATKFMSGMKPTTVHRTTLRSLSFASRYATTPIPSDISNSGNKLRRSIADDSDCIFYLPCLCETHPTSQTGSANPGPGPGNHSGWLHQPIYCWHG